MAGEGGKEGGLLKPVKKCFYWIQRRTSAGLAREGGLLKPGKNDLFLDSERHLRPKEEAQRERAASSADGATP